MTNNELTKGVKTMRIDIDYSSAKELKKASANYIEDMECFEVELIKNDRPSDTLYRIELMDGDYINITIRELKVLKQLLNNDMITRLLELDNMEDI